MDPDLPRPAPTRSPIERLREWVVWFGPGRLAATAFAVVAVVLGGMWLLEGSPSRAEDQLPFATRPSSSTVATVVEPSTSTTSSTVVVYVAGAVAAPGVYTLASPARVTDAVAAARGATGEADLDVVNLAATVHDGGGSMCRKWARSCRWWPASRWSTAPYRLARSTSTLPRSISSTCC